MYENETLRALHEELERVEKQRNELLEVLKDMVKLFEDEKFIDCGPSKGNFNLRINAAKIAIKNSK